MTDQVDALSPAGVSELANFIVRPPRAHYSRQELGDRSFTSERVPACRNDVELRNAKGQKLCGSHFRPVALGADAPTVVYLHGNGSCRVEATMLLQYVLPYGLALFAFDFSGSGRSDGEYISLGVNEKHDVESVVDYLVGECGVKRIVLWGHSMGAATAVMYAGLCERRPEVKALVLDSSFASFDKLAQSMVADMPIPLGVPRKLILSVGVRAVRKVVRERARFDVADIDPLSAARKVDAGMPALFLHGTMDAVVPLQHGELLYKNYAGMGKDFVVLKGSEHDTPRPEWAMDKVHMFLQKHLRKDGVRDLDYLEHLKGRGNVAMLAGRFADSITLYTEALDALSESLTFLSFSAAVGEARSKGDCDGANGGDTLGRRNSSISNLVSTVKRWGQARAGTAGETFSSNRSAASLRVHPNNSANVRRMSSLDTPIRPNGETRRPISVTSPVFDGEAPMARDAMSGGERHPDFSPAPDFVRRESAGWSKRSSRDGSGKPWRPRSLMDSLKKRVGLGRSRLTPESKDSVPPSNRRSFEDAQQPPDFVRDNIRGFGGRRSTARAATQNLPDSLAALHEGVSKQSRVGVSRDSQSSSRTHVRHRARRSEHRRRSRPVPASEADIRRERGWLSGDQRKQRLMNADFSALKSRFSSNASSSRQPDSLSQRDHTADILLSDQGIETWNLEESRKALVLALLGNRSLARRKIKDVHGALCDANLCLKVDATWVRAYVRKAAALREDGELELARCCVLEGLAQDADHAGLADMLRSIDLAVEAAKLALERNLTATVERPGVSVGTISGAA